MFFGKLARHIDQAAEKISAAIDRAAERIANAIRPEPGKVRSFRITETS